MTQEDRGFRLSERRVGRLIDAAFVIVLGTIALTGLDGTYDGARYLIVGVIGLCVGAIVALLTETLRTSTAIAIGIGAYLVTAGPVVFPATTMAALLPTGTTLSGIADGTINGWRDILTTEPPLPTSAGTLLIPIFLSGLAAGLTAVMVARLPFALAPLLPVVGLAIVAILFGTTRSEPPAIYTCIFVALTLAWGTLRHRRRIGAVRTDATFLRRAATPAALLTATALVVGAFDYVVAPVATDDRYVLREHVIPPFDPSAYPSPLSSFRRDEKHLREEVLFTVQGLPAGARLRLATMDFYDGVVWNVVNGNGGPADGSGVFNRMGSTIAADIEGAPARIQVTIEAYNDIWMPTAGALTRVTFEGDRAAELTESFRYNTRTGIGVLPTGLGAGDSYAIEVLIPATPTPDELSGLAVGRITLPDLRGVPQEMATVATEWVGSAGAGVPQLQTIVDALQRGAFSDGDPESGVASPPGHGAKRLRDFLSGAELVGDDEQYAATLALMARELGMPARVVLGAIPPGDAFDGSVTGDMVSAWVEVYIDGPGWVAFDPTPPVSSKPKLVQIKRQDEVEGQVLEPPVVQAQPPRPLPPPQAEEPIEEVNCLLQWFCFNGLPKWAQWVVRYLAPPVLGVAGLLLAIITAKAIRRRRRRRGPPVALVSGAWQEFVDRLRDHGLYSSPYDTRRDIAERVEGATAAKLATMADAAVFGPGDPDRAFAAEVWATVPVALREITVGRTRWRRFLAWINPVSLRPDARTLAGLMARRRRPATA